MIMQGDILESRYQLIDKIGQGGTGIVYKAYDLNLQKYVVVKKIRDHFVGNINDRIEVDILKRLHHPYLPQVYDFFIIDGQVFTVIDYVDGKDLQWFYDHHYTLDEKMLRKWIEQLLEVLSYLHNQKPVVLHNDIKPSNIMINQQGDVCLIDFGISLGDGDFSEIHGASQKYASPEQMKKLELYYQGLDYRKIILDERSDLYSLAKSIWKQMDYGAQHGVQYTDALWNIIDRAMQEKPRNRFQSADKMLYAIRNIEKTDKNYKKYFTVKLLVHFGYAICLILSVILIYSGYRVTEKEKVMNTYDRLQQAVYNEDSDNMIDIGIELLNMSEFKRQKKNMKREWITTYHSVGDGYYLKQQYANASDYYEEAVEMSEKPDNIYYLDYVSSLACAGKITDAKSILFDAQYQGVKEVYITLMESTIFVSEKKYDEAINKLNVLIQNNQEESVIAYLQLADIYELQKDSNKAIQCLENAYADKNDLRLLRRMGNIYYNMGNYESALNCFEELVRKLNPIYVDVINYAVCCEMTRDYTSAIDVLKEAAETYSWKYEAYMHLAFSSYKTRNMQEAISYYKKAKKLYGNVRTKDAMMNELERILE